MHANLQGAPRPFHDGEPPMDGAHDARVVRERVTTVLLGLFVLFVIFAGHVALHRGWMEWPIAAPLTLRAFAAATAIGIGVVELAAYRGRRHPASLIVGAAFLGVGAMKAFRVTISLIGQHTDATHLYDVSLRLGWAQNVFLPVVLILGMMLIAARPRPPGVEARPRVAFVIATIALALVAVIGAWSPAFPGGATTPGVVARPDAAWSAAAYLFLLSVLWRRPDVSATPSGRWLTFAIYVVLLNQLLVAPFWTLGTGSSTFNAIVNLVAFLIVGCGVAIGMIALSHREAAASELAARQESERARIESAIVRQAARLQKANEELERYAYLASHDLQEPLRMITSYLQLIDRRYSDVIDDEGREFMQFAVDGAHRMKRLTNDLLLYSQVSARQVEPVMTDAGEAFETARLNLAAAIDETQAVVTRDELPSVPMAAVEITQLLQNLIANALKFRREGVEPRVHLSAERRDDHWLFALADNGIGIEAQHQERVFGVFQRLHGAEAFPGSGIGLALCRQIVERHGGAIWFTSTPGGGTTFHWSVPTNLDTMTTAVDRMAEDVDPELEERATTLIERARELI